MTKTAPVIPSKTARLWYIVSNTTHPRNPLRILPLLALYSSSRCARAPASARAPFPPYAFHRTHSHPPSPRCAQQLAPVQKVAHARQANAPANQSLLRHARSAYAARQQWLSRRARSPFIPDLRSSLKLLYLYSSLLREGKWENFEILARLVVRRAGDQAGGTPPDKERCFLQYFQHTTRKFALDAAFLPTKAN